jgi:hypothetical protein
MNIDRYKKLFGLRAFLFVASLLAVLWVQAPRLADDFKVDEDFRTFYWMNKFQDSSLLPHDHLQSYYVSFDLPWGTVPVTFYSLGYGLLFYAASFVVTPVLFSKILPFFLMSITVWYLFEFGQLVRDRSTGLVLALGFLFLNLASSSAISVANGLQRSFAMTLVIVLIYYLQRRSYVAAAIAVLASALFYPPMFALGIVIWGLFALRPLFSRRSGSWLAQGGLGYLLMSGVVSVLILSPAVLPRLIDLSVTEPAVEQQAQDQPVVPPAQAYEAIWENPVYRTGGAYPLFIIFPIVGRGGLVDLGEDLINLLILLAIGLLIVLVRGGKAFDLPYVAWCLVLGTLLMFAISWWAIWLTDSFLLYLPSRYTRVGLFLFRLIFVELNLIDFVREAPTLIRRHPGRLIWLLVGIEAMVVVLIIFYPSDRASIGVLNMKYLLALAGLAVGILGFAVIRQPNRTAPDLSRIGHTFMGRALVGLVAVVALAGWAIYAPMLTEVSYLDPPEAERKLLAYLETLPKEAMLAGSPCALDSVQLFARRRIFMSCEQPRTDAVVEEALTAYYADKPQVATNFCQNHHVDYLVIDLKTYSREYLAQGWIFYEPHNQVILPRIIDQASFALAELPDDIKLFKADHYYVVRCRDLMSLAQGYGNDDDHFEH